MKLCSGLGLGSVTNLSAGVAVLFSPALKVKILRKTEIEPGRLVAVRAEISNLFFLFVNIYAPNSGTDRLQLLLTRAIFKAGSRMGILLY